jgi:bifunctional N-acetylglucosamine-1-phosphate-uridyltransferase/glucosamine-1-phosphate-acetyltransferase GlmU-like protein
MYRNQFHAAIAAISVVTAIYGAAPMYAQGQQQNVVKLKADAQKVVSIISGDKAKTQTYCRVLELNDELDQIDEQKDRKQAEDLSKKVGELEETLGPEYLALAANLEDVEPISRLGQEVSSIIENLDKTCEH